MTQPVCVYSYTRRERGQPRTRGAANADGGSAQAPTLSAFGFVTQGAKGDLPPCTIKRASQPDQAAISQPASSAEQRRMIGSWSRCFLDGRQAAHRRIPGSRSLPAVDHRHIQTQARSPQWNIISLPIRQRLSAVVQVARPIPVPLGRSPQNLTRWRAQRRALTGLDAV